MVSPIVDEVLDGYSCTVFAYGQTGTGKTYTMEGVMDHTHEGAGIIPRSIHRVFQYLKSRYDSDTSSFSVRISFLEVYNEQLIDLLSVEDDIPDEPAADKPRRHAYDAKRAARKDKAGGTKLRIVDDGRTGVQVQGLEDVLVTDEQEVFGHVSKALLKRQVAETKCNDFSSRSHAIFTMTIHLKEMTASGEEEMRVGRLHLVDLAGSENIGRSGAKDGRAREAGNINQSLLVLGRVISALVEKRSYIPYRDSKLTRLLQDSLGGSTKTCLIATVSPSSGSVEETLSTLDYASRAKCIENKPEANKKMTRNAMMRTQGAEIEALQRMLQAARAKDGVYLTQEMYDEMVASKKSVENQLEELQELKLVQEEELASMRAQLDEITTSLEELREAHEATTAELAETQGVLVTTQGDLAAKTVEAEETGVVLQAHRVAEASLHGQAQSLVGTLTASTADVDGLHSKVQRQATTAAANTAAARDFSAGVCRALADASSTSSAAMQAQAASLRSLAQDLGEQAAAAKTAAAATASTMATLTGQMQAALGRVTARVKDLAGASASDAATCSDSATQAVADVEEAVAGMQSKLSAAVAAIILASGEQMTAADAWAQRSQAALAQAAEDAESFGAEHAVQLGQVASTVEESASQASSALSAQSVALKALGVSTKTSLDKMRGDVLEAVTHALDTAVEAATMQLEDGVAEMTGSNTATSRSIQAAASKAVSGVTAASTAAEQWVATQAAALRTEVDATGTSLEEVRAAFTKAEESKAVADADLAATQVEIAAGAKETKQSITTAIRALAHSVQEGADDVEGVVGESSVAMERGMAQAGEAATTAGDAAADKAEAAAKSALTSAGAIQESSTATSAAMATVEGQVREFGASGLKEVAATGHTPAKRTYEAPVRLTVASPEDRILTRYRAHVADAGDAAGFQHLTQVTEAVAPVGTQLMAAAPAATASVPSPAPAKAPAAQSPEAVDMLAGEDEEAPAVAAASPATTKSSGRHSTDSSVTTTTTTSTASAATARGDSENVAPAGAVTGGKKKTTSTSRSRSRTGTRRGKASGLPAPRTGSRRRTRAAALTASTSN